MKTSEVQKPQEAQSWGDEGDKQGTRVRGTNFHPDGYFRPWGKRQAGALKDKGKKFDDRCPIPVSGRAPGESYFWGTEPGIPTRTSTAVGFAARSAGWNFHREKAARAN